MSEAGPDPASEIPPLTALRDCRLGRFLYFPRDRYIGRALDLYGEFCHFEGEVFAGILRQGDFAIEVGANIGAHTVHLARLVGPRGAVLALEPQRIIFQMLCANLALNEIYNVYTYRAAAGRASGTLKVPPVDYTGTGNFGGISLRGVAQGEDVPLLRLDDMTLSSVRLLKIDVEGMEGDVLEGAHGLVARHRPILYVENDRVESSAALIARIEALGYALWWHTPPLFNPDNFAGNPQNVFGRLVSINMLCVPREMPSIVPRLRPVAGPDDLSWQESPSW
jgi:FkbM family methyltransferase